MADLRPAAAGLLGRPIRGDLASLTQDPHAPLCPSASATVAAVVTWASLTFKLQLHSLAAASRGRRDLDPVGLTWFLVVRASGFDDGEASSEFRDYFWQRHLLYIFACVFHAVLEARVILASIYGFSYSEDGFYLHFVPVDYARIYIGHLVAWYSRQMRLQVVC